MLAHRAEEPELVQPLCEAAVPGVGWAGAVGELPVPSPRVAEGGSSTKSQRGQTRARCNRARAAGTQRAVAGSESGNALWRLTATKRCCLVRIKGNVCRGGIATVVSLQLAHEHRGMIQTTAGYTARSSHQELLTLAADIPVYVHALDVSS